MKKRDIENRDILVALQLKLIPEDVALESFYFPKSSMSANQKYLRKIQRMALDFIADKAKDENENP